MTFRKSILRFDNQYIYEPKHVRFTIRDIQFAKKFSMKCVCVSGITHKRRSTPPNAFSTHTFIRRAHLWRTRDNENKFACSMCARIRTLLLLTCARERSHSGDALDIKFSSMHLCVCVCVKGYVVRDTLRNLWAPRETSVHTHTSLTNLSRSSSGRVVPIRVISLASTGRLNAPQTLSPRESIRWGVACVSVCVCVCILTPTNHGHFMHSRIYRMYARIRKYTCVCVCTAVHATNVLRTITSYFEKGFIIICIMLNRFSRAESSVVLPVVRPENLSRFAATINLFI